MQPELRATYEVYWSGFGLTVVHAMVARGVQDVLEGAYRFYGVGVDPELEEEVQVLVGYELCWGNCQGQGQVKYLEF